MKSYRHWLCIGALMSFCTFLSAQGPSEADIELMQGALQEWFSANPPEGTSRGLSSTREKAFYREGYGLSIPTPVFRRSSNLTVYSIDRNNHLSTRSRGNVGQATVAVNGDQYVEEITELMKTFLKNYGDLISGLPAEEKLVLTYRDTRISGNSFVFSNGTDAQSFFTTGDDKAKPKIEITVSVPFGKLTGYRKGSVSPDALNNAMTVETQLETEPEPASYSMLKALLEPQISRIAESYFEVLKPEAQNVWGFSGSSGRMSFDNVQGYGVKYSWRYGRAHRFPRSCNCDDEDENQEVKIDAEELDSEIDEQAEDMRQDVPELLVKYGRTLRDLDPKEYLELTIAFPACKDCTAPGTMTFTVNGATLHKYDKGDLTLDGAKDEVVITTEGAAKDLGDEDNPFLLRGDAADIIINGYAIPDPAPAPALLPGTGGIDIIWKDGTAIPAPASPKTDDEDR